MNLFRSKADRDLEILSAYLDNALPTKDAARLELRLQDEPELLTQLAELRGTRRLLRDLPVLSVPRNFTLHPEDVGATIRPVNMPWMRWATTAVAFSFVFVLAADAFTTLGFGAARDAAAPQTESFAIQQDAPAEFEAAAEEELAVVEEEAVAEEADVPLELEATAPLAELPALTEPEADLLAEDVVVDAATADEEEPQAGFATTGEGAAGEAIAESEAAESGSDEVRALETTTAAATSTSEPAATITPTRTKLPSPVPTFAPPPTAQTSFGLRGVLRLFEYCLGALLIILLVVAFVRRRRTR